MQKLMNKQMTVSPLDFQRIEFQNSLDKAFREIENILLIYNMKISIGRTLTPKIEDAHFDSIRDHANMFINRLDRKLLDHSLDLETNELSARKQSVVYFETIKYLQTLIDEVIEFKHREINRPV